MNSCHFLRPEMLWLFLPLALLLWLLAHRRSRAGNWRSACDPRLLPYILQGRETKSSRWPLLITALTGMLAIVALSGPACEQREQPVFRDQSALVIALDLSRSMDATDIKPSRLIRARLKLIDILKQRQEGQTALIVYAAQAFTVSPLTDDTNTIISLVGSLDSNMMPQQGSDSAAAIASAAQLLQQAGVPKGDILLLTDGIDDNSMQTSLDEIRAHHHRVSILGIGTADGAPIALRDGGFLKDSSGSIVIPKLDTASLQQLAQAGNGRYQPISADDSDINTLLNNMSSESETNTAVDDLNTDQWHEEGPWLLLFLAPLTALAFRRGYLAVVIILLIPIPNDACAFELQQLWLNSDQRGSQKLQQGNAEQAAELFNNPEWKAAAHYRAGQYQQAVDALQDINTADALYNKGNALARLGNIQDAIDAYTQALELQPEHEDAEYNRDLLKQQQAQQQDSDDSQEGESSSNLQDNDQQQGQQSEQQTDRQQADNQQGQSSQDQPQDQAQTEEQGSAQQQDEESADQADAEQQAADAQNDEAEGDKQQAQALAEPDYSETSESDIATEQWLRRIPDDPGGLMRRKFQYQYQQQSQQSTHESEPW